MSAANLVEVRDLAVAFDGRPVFAGLTFDVREGECVAIAGPNGAGKTTLLRCLGRLLAPSAGAVWLEGRPLAEYGQRRLARRVGYVPQPGARPLPFTVYDFVLMGRYPHLSPFTAATLDDHRRAAEALACTGMAGFRDRWMDTLSGGERQTVMIAAALAQGARLLLLDEPTTFLDYRHQVAILRLLRRVNRESGLTIVSVHHDINIAAGWSDRVLGLRDGRAVFLGPSRDALRTEALAGLYDTAFYFLDDPRGGLPLAVADGHAPPAAEGKDGAPCT